MPASDINPSSFMTVDVMRMFDIMNLEGAINIKQFLDGIFQMNPTGDEKACSFTKHVEYYLLTNMFTFEQASGYIRDKFHYNSRLWRLCRVMMSQGLNTYEELQREGIVDECPCCPHPGKNLPEDWDKDPKK